MNLISSDMLNLAVPVVEKIARPAIVYVFLVVCLRIFGKRELAQLNPFDLVVLLSLSNTVQNAIIGSDNSLTGGLIGALSLLTVNYLVVRFLFKHRRLDQIVEGRPATLIDHGKVQHRALARELLTESELRVLVHREGYTHLSDIETCTLEPGGVVSIEAKQQLEEQAFRREVLERLRRLDSMVAGGSGR